MKGLGEMDVDETEQTLNRPYKERIIKQITVEDVKGGDILFEPRVNGNRSSKKRIY